LPIPLDGLSTSTLGAGECAIRGVVDLTGVILAGLGLRSGTLAAVILGGILISAFVSGLKILIAEDFLGFMNGEGESSFGGAGEGVAGG
jgi:hypothetical protein